MSLSWEGSHSADMQPGLSNDDEQNPWTRLHEPNSQYPPLYDSFLSPPRAEADPHQTLPSQGSNSNGDWEIRVALGGLELNGNNSLSSRGMFESNPGRTSNNGTDADPARYGPEMINLMLRSDSANSRMHQAHTIHTPSRTSNAAEFSSPWRQSSHRSGGSSVNLQSQIYTPHRSSAATRSRYSDSAWETDPPTPLAEDPDLGLMPDDNLASRQSYNDPQTGIWPQENAYGQGGPYLTTIDMRLGRGITSNVARSFPPAWQEIFTNADAATPFGTDYYSNGRAPNPSLSLSSTTESSVPQFPQSPYYGGSGYAIMANATANVAALPFQGPPELGYSYLPSGSGNDAFPNIAPMTALVNPPLPTTMLSPDMSLNPPASAASPTASTGTSRPSVSRCTYRGCGARFTGKFGEDNLRRHQRLDHGNEPRPICPVCDLVIQSGRRDNLKRHMRDKHPGHPLLASLNVRGKKAGRKTVFPKKSAKRKSARQSV